MIQAEVPRILLPRTRVNKARGECLLVPKLSKGDAPVLGLRIGAQPQRDVRWLHRLTYHPYQVVAQCLQVCAVA